MLFDRPHASCTNNIIYMDCPNNCKTRNEVVCTIFCFLKITSFHKPHNNFKTLPLPSKLQRENDKKICLKYSIHCCFPTYFLLLFFRDSWAENRRRRIPAVSCIKLKFTEHAQQKESNIYHRPKPDEPPTYQRHLVWVSAGYNVTSAYSCWSVFTVYSWNRKFT